MVVLFRSVHTCALLSSNLHMCIHIPDTSFWLLSSQVRVYNPFLNCSAKRTILLPSNGVIIGRMIDTGDLQLNLGSTPQEEEELLIYFDHSNR